MSQILLWAIILIEGFVTISAEILTIRQLLPMVGSSVIVTSLIIGVFLLFLAYGYRRGGHYDSDYLTILKRNFTWSALLLGIGLSYVFIYVYFAFFFQYLSQYVLWPLVTYLLLITAPLVYILGQTVPITMNLIRQAHTVGATGGKILHLSTIGSFLGAVITSLVLMNYLGVAWTIVINCILLAILVLLLYSDKKTDPIKLIILGIIIFVAYRFNVSVQNHFFVAANSYGNYAIVDDPKTTSRLLVINESRSSSIDPKNKGFPYIEAVKRVLFEDLKLTGKDILVLGAGGFTLSAEGSRGNRFVYIDIDSEIKEIVQKHFLKEINGEFVAEDARRYLESNSQKWDVIFSDVYSSARTVPAHLLTREYFSLLNDKLKEDGLVIVNIVGRPTLEDEYSRSIDNTIRSVFHQCMVSPLNYSSAHTNILYYCKKNLNVERLHLLRPFYTDDKNRSTLDLFRSFD